MNGTYGSVLSFLHHFLRPRRVAEKRLLEGHRTMLEPLGTGPRVNSAITAQKFNENQLKIPYLLYIVPGYCTDSQSSQILMNACACHAWLPLAQTRTVHTLYGSAFVRSFLWLGASHSDSVYVFCYVADCCDYYFPHSKTRAHRAARTRHLPQPQRRASQSTTPTLALSHVTD